MCLTCFLFARKAVLQVMITLTFIVPFVQIQTSAPAVPTTATVHLLHVQTQWDPLVVHVAVLTSEMAKLALIFHTVINHHQDVPLASQNPYPFIVYYVTNYRTHLEFSIPTCAL